MKNAKISFKLDRISCCANSYKNEKSSFEMQVRDGVLSVDVRYDYDQRPLRLTAKVEKSDEIELVLLSHRIQPAIDNIIHRSTSKGEP